MKEDDKKRILDLIELARMGDPEAICELRDYYQEKGDMDSYLYYASQLRTIRAADGDGKSLYELALKYERDGEFPKSYTYAAKAAGAGYERAYYYLAEKLYHASGIPEGMSEKERLATGYYWADKAMDTTQDEDRKKEAYLLLSKFQETVFTKKDMATVQKAQIDKKISQDKKIIRVAERDYVATAGELLKEGKYEKAVQELKEGADSGNIASIKNLAMLFLKGPESIRDPRKGFRLCVKLAEAGDEQFAGNALILYRNDDGISDMTQEETLRFFRTLKGFPNISERAAQLEKRYLDKAGSQAVSGNAEDPEKENRSQELNMKQIRKTLTEKNEPVPKTSCEKKSPKQGILSARKMTMSPQLLSNFSFLKSIDAEMYNDALEMEKKIKTDVKEAAHTLRTVYETMMYRCCKKNRTELERRGVQWEDLLNSDGKPVLGSMQHYLRKNGIFPKEPVSKEKVSVMMLNGSREKHHKDRILRMIGNKSSHGKIGEEDEDSISLTYENLICAVKIFRDYLFEFYEIQKKNRVPFDERIIPYGDYLVQYVNESPDESGNNSCINEVIGCRRGDNDVIDRYALIRQFKKPEAGSREETERLSLLRNRDIALEVEQEGFNAPEILASLDSTDSPFYIIAYPFTRPIRRLSAMIGTAGENADVPDFHADLSKRLELCKQIAEKVYRLYSLDPPILLRGITPDHFIITFKKANFQAYICKYDNAKMLSAREDHTLASNAVVSNEKMRKSQRLKKYVPPELTGELEQTVEACKKMALYSLGVLFKEILQWKKTLTIVRAENIEGIHYVLRNMLDNMTQGDPDKREVTFAEIITCLKEEKNLE